MQRIETATIRATTRRRIGPREIVRASLCVSILLVTAGSVSAVAQSTTDAAATPVSAPAIVQHMVEQNAIRAQHLKYFTSRRHYHIEFHGLGRSTSADMHVQATYVAGTGKSFHVLDQSGSHLLINHVLNKLLESEQDDSHEQKAALTPSNYNFVFQSKATENGRPVYLFTVTPKVKNKLLYRGRIWIDAGDYAVVRVEAQPAENPSFWIKNTDIHHIYAKSGEFWLPQTNTSESKVRLGGTAVLTIDYGTYQFEPHNATAAAAHELTSGTAQFEPK
jgi:hypothetical protein